MIREEDQVDCVCACTGDRVGQYKLSGGGGGRCKTFSGGRPFTSSGAS